MQWTWLTQTEDFSSSGWRVFGQKSQVLQSKKLKKGKENFSKGHKQTRKKSQFFVSVFQLPLISLIAFHAQLLGDTGGHLQ